MRVQLKLYHWQTKVYARHIATDKILEELENSIDTFIEVYIGKYNKYKITSEYSTITLQNRTEPGIVKYVQGCIKHLQLLTKKFNPIYDTDILNIRDEILSQLDHLLYLFRLH